MLFSNKNTNLILFILPVIFGLVVYLNGLNAPFQYDDYDTVLQNRNIRVIEDVKSIFTHSLFRPILFLTFAVNYAISGLNPLSYHIFNVILHLINIFFVSLLVRRITLFFLSDEDSIKVAFLSSTLFAIHPIGTEAITYISSRSSLLATFFFLAGMISYTQYYKTEQKFQKIMYYSFTIIFFLLGAGAKEIILTLPIILILTDIICLRLNYKASIKRVFSTHLPFVLIITAGLILRLYFFFTYEKVGGVLPRSIYENLLTQSEVIIKYIRLLLIPFGQNLIHNYPTVRSILNFYTLLCIFTLLSLIWYAIKYHYKKPVISYGVLWFFITLLPSSSFIPFQEAMTEKHIYLPMIGFFISISFIILTISKKFTDYQRYISLALITILVILSILTIYRNYIWSDSIRLWEDIIKKTPDSWATHYAYADALRKQAESDIVNSFQSYKMGDEGISQEYMNRYQENLIKAIKHYIESIYYRPAYIDAILNTGICYGMLANVTKSENDFREAERFFKIVRELDPENTKALNNLANLYMLRGDFDSAIKLYDEVLSRDGSNMNALNNLIQIYLNVKKDFKKAREIILKLIEVYKYYREFDRVKELENILKSLPD
ncbi:MAG: tetratricopeptide repeat protein [Myxococcota bacterium]